MDNLFAGIKNTAGMVAKKSGELFELSKTKLNIANIKADINSNFKTLGEMLYISHKTSEELDSQKIEEILSSIDSLYEKLSDCNEVAAGLTNKKLCPSCNKKNDLEATFCSSCGHNFEPVEE